MQEVREKLFHNSRANVGVEQGLTEEISRRVIEHRNRFRRLIFNRFTEFLPLLINYTDKDKTAIDFTQLEVGLRMGYQVVVGKARNDQIMILGYIQSKYYKSSNDYFKNFSLNIEHRLTQDDITFTIPEYLVPNQIMEIQRYDQCKSGDFIVLRNKPVTLNNDYELLEHYCDELCEIVLSRYSLIMQSKFAKIFVSDINDSSVEQFITQLFNGSPFMKVDPYFDPEDDIIDLGSDHVTSALTEMKREYQNKVSELCNILGINSLAVDKESGVSDTEANSNRSFTTGNSSIYLRGRETFDMLNKRYAGDSRYNFNIKPFYDDEVVSSLDIMNVETGNFGGDQNG